MSQLTPEDIAEYDQARAEVKRMLADTVAVYRRPVDPAHPTAAYDSCLLALEMVDKELLGPLLAEAVAQLAARTEEPGEVE